MPRTWSNAKKPHDDLSAAQRARLGRPSSLSAFSVGMALVVVFFLGLTLYTAFHALRHPPTENNSTAAVPAPAPR